MRPEVVTWTPEALPASCWMKLEEAFSAISLPLIWEMELVTSFFICTPYPTTTSSSRLLLSMLI